MKLQNSSKTAVVLRIPRIILPVSALIASIAITHLMIGHQYRPWAIALIFSGPLILLGIIGFLKPTVRFFVIITTLSIIGGFLRITSLYQAFNSFPFADEPQTIEGTVLSIEKVEQPRTPYCLTLHTHRITKGEGATLKIDHRIQLHSKERPEVMVGDSVIIEGLIIKKPKQSNSSFALYLMKEGILTTLFPHQINYRIMNHPTHSVRRWLSQYKTELLARLKKQLSPATYYLFSSLFLGVRNKKALETVTQQFKQWGIVHYLARSGLHLTVIISLYELLFRFIPLPFLVQQLLMLLLGILYFLLSWSSISFIRAFIMFLYYKVTLLARMPTQFLHILLATCYLVLLINPFQLFFIDFQLSFLLTFALGWLNLCRD